MSVGLGLVRAALAAAGFAAIAWSAVAMPALLSEQVVVRAGRAIAAGEGYRAEVLDAIESRIAPERVAKLRSSVLGDVAVIRLRLAELAIRANAGRIDERLDALRESTALALANAPGDSFLWLARFWLENTRNGLQPAHFPLLQASYDFGPHEGWVALRRNRLALAAFPLLPDGLSARAVAEFAGFVRWGLVREAADLVEGPGRALRSRLYTALGDLKDDRRRAFARELYRRDLDDVPVPGVDVTRPAWR